jgi:hypothetical protein
MTPRPNTPHPPTQSAEGVEARLRQLEAAWLAETAHLSSSSKIVAHPAFREIVGLGEAVIPFLLRDLEERPRLWVWALAEITGADPVPPEDRGDIARMRDAWLHWGKESGY